MIIGDLNINIMRTTATSNEYLDMLYGYGFKSFIYVSTRTPIECTHSCVDRIFVKYIIIMIIMRRELYKQIYLITI